MADDPIQDPTDNHRELAAIAFTRICAGVNNREAGPTQQQITDGLALIGDSDADRDDLIAGYAIVTHGLARWVAGLINRCSATDDMDAVGVLAAVTEVLTEGDARR
jgi:hypothetical protein